MHSITLRAFNRVKAKVFPGPIGAVIYKAWNRTKRQFVCPFCGYHGPFYDINPETGYTKNEHCPKCGCNARMRLHYLVMERLRRKLRLSEWSILHFAPDIVLGSYFRKVFRQYRSADLQNPRADYQVDLLDLPFDDRSYEFIFASHVLEHIKNDQQALAEIKRVLKPGGVAVLPVPIVVVKTLEYEEPKPEEDGHVRAPGLDYFERYSQHFSQVEVFNSSDVPEEHQPYSYEDRSNWPTEKMPMRQAMHGERHLDYVPVCFV